MRTNNLNENSSKAEKIAFFNSIVDKDCWILCRMFDGITYFDAWVSLVNVDSIDGTYYYDADIFDFHDYSTYYDLTPNEIKVYFPIEMITTAELDDIASMNDIGEW